MAYSFKGSCEAFEDATNLTNLQSANSIASVAVGDILVAVARTSSSTTPGSVTDTLGNTYTARTPDLDYSAASSRYYKIFTCVSAFAGSAVKLTVNPTAGTDDRLAIAGACYGGCSGYDVSNTGIQGSPTTATDAVTISATPSAQPACAIGFSVAEVTTAGPTAGTVNSPTDRGAIWSASNTPARLEDRRLTSTSSQAMTFTKSTNTGAGSIIVILTESAGVGGAPNQMGHMVMVMP